MTPKEFYEGSMSSLLSRCDKIMRSKMVDYAQTDDFADNFKRSASRCGITPAQVWLVFADKHWGSICNFIKNGYVESEDIRNRLADLINYACLLAGMIDAGVVCGRESLHSVDAFEIGNDVVTTANAMEMLDTIERSEEDA